ncbi:MAG: hypothetical protein COB60_10105 [Flavobacteriaceae bacterium]|nr:MAG: hypothetical protein COB60_10105 [Flavobacteriaceae bacterium]
MKYLLVILLLLSGFVRSQEIKATSGWYQIMRVSDIENAGNDYPLYVESKKKETKISVKAFPKSKQMDLYGFFTVFVHHEPVFWDESLELSVRRTSKGKGKKGSINGGETWQQVHRFAGDFFRLVGKGKNVDVQYRIKGLSVLLPVNTYSTEVVYTVLNL